MILGLVLAAALAQGQRPSGEAIAAERCAACHAVGPSGASPRPDAPPFRFLGRRYPVSDLIQALAEGARPTHAGMPGFALPLEEARALSAYVRSIQTP